MATSSETEPRSERERDWTQAPTPVLLTRKVECTGDEPGEQVPHGVSAQNRYEKTGQTNRCQSPRDRVFPMQLLNLKSIYERLRNPGRPPSFGVVDPTEFHLRM